MRKQFMKESGFVSLRAASSFFLGLSGLCLALFSFAATPPTGTLSDTVPTLTYDAGPFYIANQTPAGLGQLDVGPRCNSQFPCDSYGLTVSLPPGYLTQHPNASIKATMFWTDTGTGNADYDLYIYNGVVGDLGGNQPASYQAASGANPEIASVIPLVEGTAQYTFKIVPYVPTAETVHVRLELLQGSGTGGGVPGFGGADPTTPGLPRYQIFVAPTGSSAEVGNGEFNIGFNPATGRIMTMNSGPVWRLTPPERLVPSKPACCEALWEDKTNVTTITGLDPILWTDQKTGRTFASNSTVGTNGIYAFSDNDGDLWNPLSASPPNASSDHQTIGSGPYPASLIGLINPINHGEAVYYCAQTFPVGAAACQRSDTLGDSYGPSTFPYTGNAGDPCSGIHGHVRVGPDGAVYLPIRDCSGNAGMSVSTDGGITWTERIVPNTTTQPHGTDPSIAIGANNTVYFFYVAANGAGTEGHAMVQITHDKGVTWSNAFDLGASHGIKNATFPEAMAGDDNRAAVGFLGTDIPGNYEGADFPGYWYLFIATTYDGGSTWNVVNATPNDPVQGKAGIWQGGGGNQNRNLLDFNEVTLDDKGRVLFGFSDGCVGGCVGDPSHNSYTANMRVARQSGGKGLLANFDPVEPALPKPPCLSGVRYSSGSTLTWKVPDNGGSDITSYRIFRGTSPGSETYLDQTVNAHPLYIDHTASPSVPHYYYVVKAINAQGLGAQSNEIDLVLVPDPPVETSCVTPGLTKLMDASGDSLGGPGTDLLSFQIAQPHASDGVPKLVFTLNTDPGLAVQPLHSFWYVSMRFINGTASTYKAVRMVWNGATPTFESYTPAAGSSGVIDGRFVTAGTQVPAEASSSYASPYNKVVIVVKASDLGLAPGDVISGFVSGVPQDVVVGATLYDQMPESLSYTGVFTVTDNQACALTGSPTPAPTAVPTATPTPGATSTPSLIVNISGNVAYCTKPSPNPVPSVTLTLTGTGSGSTLSNGAGNYQFSLTTGGTYVVTPTKPARVPGSIGGSGGINTTDVVATQRHFLQLTLLSGCALSAADTNADGAVNTIDITAIQRFYLGQTSGIANVGKYQFTPASRTYPVILSNQTGQNYQALVFGDVATPFSERPDSAPDSNANVDVQSGRVESVTLPQVAFDQSKAKLAVVGVQTTTINPQDRLIAFQGDFTFDERLVRFDSEPVQKAGLTSGNWNVSGNVLPGTGPIRRVRISAYSIDFTPLSGAGTLFELRMVRAGASTKEAQLSWADGADGFVFIDADLNLERPTVAGAGRASASTAR